MTLKFFLLVAISLCHVPSVWAINGAALVVRSSGTNGSNALFNDNGFVGSYITLPAPGNVTVTVNASGTAFDGVNPRMNFALGDSLVGFDVTPSGFNNYQHTFTNLPAGTHFLRAEFTNDRDTSRSLSIATLDVAGATLLNTNTDANALAAADNYVANFRRGPAHVSLLGAMPGSAVGVKLKRHAFNFGTTVPNSFNDTVLGPTGSPWIDSAQEIADAANYKQALIDNRFNSLSAENAGKWGSNESNRDVINTMFNDGRPAVPYLDYIMDFAEANDIRFRAHNLIWGPNSSGGNNQQPGWAHTMLQNPSAVDPVSGNVNSVALRDEISERIDWYVEDRAQRFYEIDVYNESYHTGSNQGHSSNTYWEVYGPAGIAEIYKETKDAIEAGGGTSKVFVNEYNVLQPFEFGTYANGYMRHVEEIRNAGYALYGDSEEVVSGIGFQYYVDAGSLSNHSSSRVYATMQNLAVQGLDMHLTEWGGRGTNNATTEANAATILNRTARLVFGMPGTTGITLWNLRNVPGTFAPVGTFYDNDWTIRDPAIAWQALMDQWDTDLNLTVLPDGTIDFTGFYGKYEITIGEQTFLLDLAKGVTDYSLVVGPPSADFDQDGDVDGRDFLAWQRGFGLPQPTFGDGDANYDGAVDATDLEIWQSAYGIGGLATSTTVPEPISLCMVLTSLLIFPTCRRI